MDFEMVLLELQKQGITGCSQIMAKLAMDLVGQDNPGLIRAMSGLTGGMGDAGSACGVLTGGAAAIGFLAGKGEEGEIPHEDYKEIIRKYVEWFKETYGTDRCYDIIKGDKVYSKEVCPGIIEAGYYKMVELLDEYGVLEE